jgi:hypothetical protein
LNPGQQACPSPELFFAGLFFAVVMHLRTPRPAQTFTPHHAKPFAVRVGPNPCRPLRTAAVTESPPSPWTHPPRAHPA